MNLSQFLKLTYFFILFHPSFVLSMEWKKDNSGFKWSDEENKNKDDTSSGDSFHSSNSLEENTLNLLREEFQELNWDQFVDSTLLNEGQKELLKSYEDCIEDKKKLTEKIEHYFKNVDYKKIEDFLEINRSLELPTLKKSCLKEFKKKINDKRFVDKMLKNSCFLNCCHEWKTTKIKRIPECVLGLLKFGKAEPCDKPEVEWIEQATIEKKIDDKKIQFIIRGVQFDYNRTDQNEAMIWADRTNDSKKRFVILANPNECKVFDNKKKASIFTIKPRIGIRKVEFIDNTAFLCLFNDGNLVKYSCPEGKILETNHNIAMFQKHPDRSYYLTLDQIGLISLLDPFLSQNCSIGHAHGFKDFNPIMKFSDSFLKVSFLTNKHHATRKKQYFSLKQLNDIDDMIQKPLCLGKCFIIARAIKHGQSINLTNNEKLKSVFEQFEPTLQNILKNYKVRTETSVPIRVYDALIDTFKNFF